MEHSERWGRVYPNSRAGEPWPRKGTGRTRWLQEVTDSAIDNTAECRTLMAIQAALWSPSAPDYDSMSDDCNALDQEYVVDDENRATRSRRRSREPRSSEEPSTRRALQPRAASPAAVQQLEPATAAADPPVNENDISAALFWEPCALLNRVLAVHGSTVSGCRLAMLEVLFRSRKSNPICTGNNRSH